MGLFDKVTKVVRDSPTPLAPFGRAASNRGITSKIFGGGVLGTALLGPGLGTTVGGGLGALMGAFPGARQIDPSQISDPGLRAELEKKRKAREETLAAAKSLEAQKGQQLMSTQTTSEAAIDKQLAGLLQETGIASGLQRRAIGSQQAQTGLLRSGFTGQRLEQSRLGELQTKGELRAGAERQKEDIKRSITDVKQSIADKRRQMRLDLDELELQSLRGEAFRQESEQIKQEYNTFVNNLNIGSANRAAILALIGGGAQVGGYAVGAARRDSANEEEA